jgi:conserved oligomeric Golgi complex subunit 5
LLFFFVLVSYPLQVYILEKVLRIKKDITTDVPFLDEAMRVSKYLNSLGERSRRTSKALDSKPSTIFWSTLARCLEERAREAVKGSRSIVPLRQL